MRKLSLLLCASFFIVLHAGAIIDASLQMQLGNPSNATADTNNHVNYLIQRPVLAMDYNDNRGLANWVSWNLTASDLGSSGRSPSFFTDTNLPGNFYKVTTTEYTGSGYDRGHLCPSGDRTVTVEYNEMTFYMSNIMPQAPDNNQGVWANFESYCRSLATAGNELLIICGPSGFTGLKLPSGTVEIPSYTWKIAVVVPPGVGSALARIDADTRVISLKVPNSNNISSSWQNFVTSANEIQVDTGFTFFTALPPDLAAVLRNKVDGQTNPPPAITSFSPTSGLPGAVVTVTGSNFTYASSVRFSGTSASFTVNSSNQITAVVPTNASSGTLSVTTPHGTAISSNSFKVVGAPEIVVLAGWDMNSLPGGQNNYGPSPFPATTNAPGVTASGLVRGAGVSTNGTAAARAWGGAAFTNTTATSAIGSNQFVTFTITASPTNNVSFHSVSRFDYRRSSTGATNGLLQYQVGAGPFVDVATFNYPASTSSGGSVSPIDLSTIPALQRVGAGTNVTFRIVNWGGTSSAGTWYVYDVSNSPGLDFAISGSVIPDSEPTPVEAWRLAWFGTAEDVGVAADSAIGTSDGMPNLVKYALGLDPTVPTNNPVKADVETGYLRLTSPRNPDATDVVFQVERSDSIPGPWTTNGTFIEENAPTLLRVRDTEPVTNSVQRFLRLRVYRN